jgi:hypothetical protein
LTTSTLLKAVPYRKGGSFWRIYFFSFPPQKSFFASARQKILCYSPKKGFNQLSYY